MKTRKFLVLLLAITLVLASVTGCSQQSVQTSPEATQTTTAESTSAVAESTTPAETATPVEPITFTVRSVQPGKDWLSDDLPVWKAITEKTGVSIKMEYSVGDENQNVALIIASGDMPDAVASHYIVAPFIDSKVAIELTDLIDNYAPNYKKALGVDYDRMVWSKEDQGRYFISLPEQYPDELEYKNWFMLQHSVVMDQGYPEIKTLQQYEDAIRAYMTKYPTIDGNPTIGMTMVCDTWRWILSLTNPSMMAAGVEASNEVYVDQSTGKVTYRVTRTEEKEYYRWLNHMYNTGLLDKEAFTQTYDQYKAKVASGRVLALTDMAWSIADAEKVLREDGKPERTYGAYPIVVKDGVVNSSLSGERKYKVPIAQLVLTTSCEAPERFMQFIDFMASEEGQILNNWGVEGTHYDIVDGKRVFKTEELQKKATDQDYGYKTGIGLFSYVAYMNGVKDSTGQYFTLSSKEDIVAQYSDVDKQVLKGYGLTTWADFFAPATTFKIREWPEGAYSKIPADSEESVIFQKLQDTVKKGVIRALVATPDQFDDEWDAFLEEMQQAGQAKFEAACEKLMQEQLEITGK